VLGPEFVDPPREFSLCPFWFWNDDLSEDELRRQIEDFQAHGVHAFVIHPRVGLPRDTGWMSEKLLGFIRFAVEEAARRGMWVVLYDEGMYPSGSSSGQVVAENPDYRCHAWSRERGVIECRPIDSVIRGLHYVGEGPFEDEPPAADLLNPDAVACFIRLVYDRYASVLGEYFGTTIKGIFTDEPSLLGRPREKDLVPGTPGILGHVLRLTAEDLTERTQELWDSTSETRRIYDRGVRLRLEETYYLQLSIWCREHGIALMGHSEHPDDLSAMAYFDVPGQDLVWRWVLPGSTALEGPQSTQAKAAASSMQLAGKRRNSNEFAGAYGHELTFAEFKWLLDWCVMRGTNMFFPHAFYYSIRGPRWDERPPDVGPHSAWWDRFALFASYAARLSWLNTDSEHVCPVAILEQDGALPWQAAKYCFQNQIDFIYVPTSEQADGRLVVRDSEVDRLDSAPRVLEVERHPDLRLRHVIKKGCDVYLAHNEGLDTAIDLALPGEFVRIDPMTLDELAVNRLVLAPGELVLLVRVLFSV